jgi:hypothetical protein
MSNDDRIIQDYMALLNHLSPDLKLRLIVQLANSLRKDYKETAPMSDESWKSLFGAWKDTDDNLADLVRAQKFPD